ncbi:MAG: GNAT family N-acetyltransferase [Candidatus Thorarchaeota archaeon]|nr:GNAT family N-acetyltransferase [Candidatus Thorarchaeota archaeon]
MSSDNTQDSVSSATRSYLIMKAESKEALKLAEEWWSEKEIPSYVKISTLNMDDIEEFVDLYNRCFLASPDPFCPLTSEEALKLDTEGIFIAKLAGKMAGFIACFVEKKTESIYGEITGIGVLPNRRRKGVATALIKRATQYFLDSGAEEVYCEVYEENIPSQMLIMTYGFKEAGRREVPLQPSSTSKSGFDLPGGKIMRRLGLRPRTGCETCRDI